MQIPFLAVLSQAGQYTSKTPSDGGTTPETAQTGLEDDVAFEKVFDFALQPATPPAADATAGFKPPVAEPDEAGDGLTLSDQADGDEHPIALTPQKIATIMASTAHQGLPDAASAAPANTSTPIVGRSLASEERMPQTMSPATPGSARVAAQQSTPGVEIAVPEHSETRFVPRTADVTAGTTSRSDVFQTVLTPKPTEPTQGNDMPRENTRTIGIPPEQVTAPAKVPVTAAEQIARASRTGSEPLAHVPVGQVLRHAVRVDTRDAPSGWDRPLVTKATQNAPVPNGGPAPAAAIIPATVQNQPQEFAIPSDPEPVHSISWDVRGQMQFAHGPAGPIHIVRAELPPHIAQQIAATMANAPDKPIEIALNPPELGRVRMVLSTTELGITVQVLTERADTLEMMRRNIGELGNSLAELGYDDIAFSFGQGGDTTDASDDDTASGAGTLIDLDPGDETPTDTTQSPLAHLSDGIDMRL
ncbi:MAG: flagellar hook-length control protein FliK [Pseudomonadota bacterium]